MSRFTAAIFALCLVASAMAFVPSTPALTGFKAGAISSGPKLNRAPRVAPKMSVTPLAEVATNALLIAGEGMEVSVAAYLAVLLGTFIPVVFLVTLYIQTESSKSSSG